MAKPKPFFGKIVTGQVLTEGYIIDWSNDLLVKKEYEFTPSLVNVRKWKKSISKVEIVNETNAKNVKDSIIRGTVGGVALGGVGALAGVMSAKSDSSFNVMITYHNNHLDLIACDIKLYTKLLQQANENSTLGISEYEDVYVSDEEKIKNDEEWRKKGEGLEWLGCLVIIGVVAFIGWLIWAVFFWEV